MPTILRPIRPPPSWGAIPVPLLEDGLAETTLYRPRAPLPPERGRTLPDGSPKGLTALYNIAAADMRRQGARSG